MVTFVSFGPHRLSFAYGKCFADRLEDVGLDEPLVEIRELVVSALADGAVLVVTRGHDDLHGLVVGRKGHLDSGAPRRREWRISDSCGHDPKRHAGWTELPVAIGAFLLVAQACLVSRLVQVNDELLEHG